MDAAFFMSHCHQFDGKVSALVTLFKDCDTTWWSYVESNAGGWGEQGREALKAMVDTNPESPGPCAATFKNMIESGFRRVRESTQCRDKYRTCLFDLDCRIELDESIGAVMYPAARQQFEGTLCSKTWQMQDLYECVEQHVFDRQFPWNQQRCYEPNRITAASQCNLIFEAVRERCPRSGGGNDC